MTNKLPEIGKKYKDKRTQNTYTLKAIEGVFVPKVDEKTKFILDEEELLSYKFFLKAAKDEEYSSFIHDQFLDLQSFLDYYDEVLNDK